MIDRDDIAVRMMQSLVLQPEEGSTITTVRQALGLKSEVRYDHQIHWPQYLARRSVVMADALIAELESSK